MNPVRYGAKDCEARRYVDLATRFGTPLLAFDRRRLERAYQRLRRALPGVDLYYAVKALPEPAVIEALAALGAGFDVASAGEAELLQAARIPGWRTIHTHPVKKDAEIRSALRFGATTMVVDNIEELAKLAPYRSRIGVLLRVAFRAPDALVDLSRKFGCAPREVPSILDAARRMGVHVKGLSFHVGSQCRDPGTHVGAIEQAAEMMRAAPGDAPMSVLDIGGGFPVSYGDGPADLNAFCAPIRAAVQRLPLDWQVIAEPGRALVAGAVTGIFAVTGRSFRDGQPWYFLDDGVYGSFSGQIFDHVRYPLQVLSDGPRRASMLAGPTCDSIDMVAENLQLPELAAGDLVIAHMMGAYTRATRTRFNLIPSARFVDIRAQGV